MKLDWYIGPSCPDYPVTFERYEREGMGGSESHVLLLLAALAKRHEVTLYGDVGPVVERGVNFLPRAAFTMGGERDVLVWHRTPQPERPEMFAEATAGFKVAWNPDGWARGGLEATKPLWEQHFYGPADVVWNISRWQRSLIVGLYDTDPVKHVVLPCAIDTAPFRRLDMAAKHATDLVAHSATPECASGAPLTMIYCSVPNRGLDRVIAWWPRISHILEKRCRLHICGDASIHGAESSAAGIRYEHAYFFNENPNATYHGAVSRRELSALQGASHIWIYPTSFDEHFCLSAAECQAAGALPVATARAGLDYTVVNGETGLLVPVGPNFEGRFTEELFALCRDPERRTAMAMAGRRRANDLFAASRVAQRFERVIAGERPYHFGGPQ